jgi:L-threonylcarbamoyladenylate synthase
MPKTIFPSEIRRAAEAIRRGELVIFPTETVYGVGANALDENAVLRIFEAKGRPHSSPLIVHVAGVAEARELALEWPDSAERLAERFWPGPLTLVVAKKPSIPDIVTAGLPSVGLRMPANEIALALIRESGVPIAAPSANRFTELSPTTAEHARRSLGDRVSVILDGGPTEVGIESAVVAVKYGAVRLLRPGILTARQIEEVVGPIVIGDASEKAASPGQHPRHYQPRTRVLLATADQLPRQGRGAYLYRLEAAACVVPVAMPQDARDYAAVLFSTLHELDERHLDWIAIEPVPETQEWEGIRDRLGRAASTVGWCPQPTPLHPDG